MATSDLKAAEKELADAQAATARWNAEQERRARAQGRKIRRTTRIGNQFRIGNGGTYGGTLLKRTTGDAVIKNILSKMPLGKRPKFFKGGNVVQRWVPNKNSLTGFTSGNSESDLPQPDGRWKTVKDARPKNWKSDNPFYEGTDDLFTTDAETGAANFLTGKWVNGKFVKDGFGDTTMDPTDRQEARRVYVKGEDRKDFNERLEKWEKKKVKAEKTATRRAIKRWRTRHDRLTRLGEKADRQRQRQTERAERSHGEGRDKTNNMVARQSTTPYNANLLKAELNSNRSTVAGGASTTATRLNPFASNLTAGK